MQMMKPNFEHSKPDSGKKNALTRSCVFMDEPIFSSLKQFVGEQLNAVSHRSNSRVPSNFLRSGQQIQTLKRYLRAEAQSGNSVGRKDCIEDQ